MKHCGAEKFDERIGATWVCTLPAGHFSKLHDASGAFDWTDPEDHTGETRITSSTGGQKGQKPERYDLIPVEALAHVARVFGAGARKYSDHNYRKGYDWSLSYAALQRHATQFWGGEDTDPEMGTPHLASVIFHAMALLVFMDEHPEFDDRYTTKKEQA